MDGTGHDRRRSASANAALLLAAALIPVLGAIDTIRDRPHRGAALGVPDVHRSRRRRRGRADSDPVDAVTGSGQRAAWARLCGPPRLACRSGQRAAVPST